MPFPPKPLLTALKTHGLPLLLLLIIFLIVQTVFLQPIGLTDEKNYFFMALEPEKIHIVHQGLRIGLILPVMLALKLFGLSEAAYYLFPYIATWLLLLGTYTVGTLLFRRSVGFCAALLLLCNPYILNESGQLLPDIPGTACLLLGLACLLSVGKSMSTETETSSLNRNHILYFILAGFCFGWAYLTREFLILLLFPLIGIVFWLYKLRLKYLPFLMLPMAFLFGLEMFWGSTFFGNPLIRFAKSINPRKTHKLILEGWDVVAAFPNNLLNYDIGWLWIGLLAVFLSGLWFLRKEKSYRFIFTWFIGIFGLYTFIGLFPMGSHRTLLRLQKIRYWMPIFPALAIGSIAVLQVLLTNLQNHWFRAKPLSPSFLFSIMVFLLTGINLIASLSIDNFIFFGGNEYWRIRQMLATPAFSQAPIIWTDFQTAKILQIYSKSFFGKPVWNGQTKVFFKQANRQVFCDGDQYLASEGIHNGWVILQKRSLSFVQQRCLNRPHHEYRWAPARHWQLRAAAPLVDLKEEKGHPNNDNLLIYKVNSPSVSNADKNLKPSHSWQVQSHWDSSKPLAILFPQENRYDFQTTLPEAFIITNEVQPSSGPINVLSLPNAYLTVQTALKTSSPKKISFFCQWIIPNHPSKITHGISMHSPFHSSQQVQWVCPVPLGAQRAEKIRVGIKTSGPTEIQFESPEIFAGQSLGNINLSENKSW